MILQLSDRDFRLLLDMVYSGNWVLNSTREGDRIRQYDKVQRIVFAHCDSAGLGLLCENGCEPSREYVEGGIHEAIADYEDAVFFGILAEELARRDLGLESSDPEDFSELQNRMEDYMAEFEKNGLNTISIDI